MIEVKNLNYIKNQHILKDINLTIEDNEFATIIGPNGAGKSTLIKIILGLIDDHQGEVYIDGISHKKWLKDNIIGYLPQYESFDRNFPATVEDIVLMGIAGIKGAGRHFNKQDREKAHEMLKRMNMHEKKNYLIGKISGGEFQKVLIARALIADSKYVILDEPESGVDKNAIKDFYDFLISLNKAGKTIIMISHDIGMLTQYTQFVICLNKVLHCHKKAELLDAEMIKKTYGEIMQLIEKEY